MPKSYSEQEKQYIIRRLKEEAAKCLVKYGIRKTTVDELVKRVKIPKGTFYLFYPSKEVLLFEVFTDFHEQFEMQMTQTLENIDTANISCESMTELIFKFFKIADENPMVKLLTSDEIEILSRKLPTDILDNHFSKDDTMMDKILASFPNGRNKDIAAFSTAFRNVFMSMISYHELGEENADKALKLLIRGLVIQLME